MLTMKNLKVYIYIHMSIIIQYVKIVMENKSWNYLRNILWKQSPPTTYHRLYKKYKFYIPFSPNLIFNVFGSQRWFLNKIEINEMGQYGPLLIEPLGRLASEIWCHQHKKCVGYPQESIYRPCALKHTFLSSHPVIPLINIIKVSTYLLTNYVYL